jgi:hypothetical protein
MYNPIHLDHLVIGNYNYRVFGKQEYTTFGNKGTKKLATRSAELFPFRGMPRKGKNAHLPPKFLRRCQ